MSQYSQTLNLARGSLVSAMCSQILVIRFFDAGIARPIKFDVCHWRTISVKDRIDLRIGKAGILALHFVRIAHISANPSAFQFHYFLGIAIENPEMFIYAIVIHFVISFHFALILCSKRGKH